MDKISKSLSKLTPKEQKQVKSILARLNRGDKSGLDIKKLKGREDIFRIRKGNIRIIYKTDKKSIFVLAIERRNDTTYSF
ncbi:MAG: type II toxin-antitoxin system RelE/ParE family toxin [Parcubacteria group bacterium]|nr:type II toxin-antitoxin system RelE/ParE family toxin [Parcubacteria group bacterium]